MTLTQLRAFVAVATTGSVRGAAERLFVSQPGRLRRPGCAATGAGGPAGHPRRPGAAADFSGRIIARYARQLLRLLDEAKAATVAQPIPNRAGCGWRRSPPPASTCCPGSSPPSAPNTPTPSCPWRWATARAWDLLEHREVDLAVGGRPPGSGRFVNLATRPNVLVLVAAPPAGRPQSATRLISMGELRDQVLLLREPGSGTRSTAEDVLEDLGVSLPTLTLGSNGAIRESVQVGLGITLISRDAVARELEEGSLEEWRFHPMPLGRTWHLEARAGDQLPPTAQLLLTHLADPAKTDGDDRFRLVDGDRLA